MSTNNDVKEAVDLLKQIEEEARKHRTKLVLGDILIEARRKSVGMGEAKDGSVPFQNPPSIYDRPIQEHGGGKYLRKIHSADGKGGPINVDVYCVIEAFGITCPALQHALKKILACGKRGKGSAVDDIHGVFDAMWRALELQKQREASSENVQREEQAQV